MGTVVVTLAVAVLLAAARGGRLAALGRVPLRDRWLVLVAAGVQVLSALAVPLLGRAGVGAYRVGLVVSALAALAFCVRNVRLPGIALVAAGLLANAAVVAANGAMPVSRWAAERAGLDPAVAERRDDLRHEPADSATRLRPLGDVVPVALPGRPEVVSPGDVLVAAGVGHLVVAVAGRGRQGRRQRSRARGGLWEAVGLSHLTSGGPMAKKGRKRRARKKSAANHGKRPNA